MFTTVKNYIEDRLGELDQIDAPRIEILDQIRDFIKKTDDPQLNFICTHNSRRSHLGQVWAQVAASHFGVSVSTYSGGTVATAFHPNAVAALERAGLEISKGDGDNPLYELKYADEHAAIKCFSKEYDHEINPKSNFAAIMTCSEADAECPIVFGAAARFKLFYVDPKEADGTPAEASTYDERCAQIAREQLYVFSTL